MVEAIESLDRDLLQLRAGEVAPSEYAAFVHQWFTLRNRVEAEEDTIRWPWEPNDLEQALRDLQAEGAMTVARLTEQQEADRRAAARQLADVEERARAIAIQVSAIDSRLILAEKPVETDLLLKQARAFYEQGRYEQSLQASDRASHYLTAQSALLQRELGRYASPDRIAQWQRMARETIEWSKKHRTSAIVISKAERSLTLYRSDRSCYRTPSGSALTASGKSVTKATAPRRKGAIASPASEDAGRHNTIGPCCWIIRTRKIDGGF
jgi:hypothetical protein